MKHLSIKTLAGSGLLLLTLTASGQYPGRPQYPDRYQVPDQRGPRDRDRLFDRVRIDLDRASFGTLPFTGDRNRIAIARERVNEVQRMVSSGNLDSRMFDDAMASMRRVVDRNHLSDGSRDLLRDDMSELHRLQERMEGY